VTSRPQSHFKPEQGLRFDSSKVLLDPYGLAAAIPKDYLRAYGDTPAMKSIVADPGTYDWEGDLPLQRPFAETVIYEMHAASLAIQVPAWRPKRRGPIRISREDSLPRRFGDNGGRVYANFPIRRGRCATGKGELLGIFTNFVLRGASRDRVCSGRWTNFATWPGRSIVRVSRSFWTWSLTTPQKVARRADLLLLRADER
jgi:hypothetical protein